MIIYRLDHPHAENSTGAVCPVGKMGPDYFFLGGNSTPGPIFFRSEWLTLAYFPRVRSTWEVVYATITGPSPL